MAILEAILSSLKGDAAIREARSNPTWIAVWSRYCGLAFTLASAEYDEDARDGVATLTTDSARKMASYSLSDDPLTAAYGMAAINSLIDVNERHCEELNARDFLLQRAVDKNVALVGHFPFVPELRLAASRLSVLELRPRAGDLPASEAERAIPEADILAITGTAFLNHTIEPLLSYRRPGALVIVLGPTTPLSPVLFDFGVDIISGVRVTDPQLVLRQVSQGVTFRQMQGMRLLTMRRRGLDLAPL